MRCYICDEMLEDHELSYEEPVCDSCGHVIEEAIEEPMEDK